MSLDFGLVVNVAAGYVLGRALVLFVQVGWAVWTEG